LQGKLSIGVGNGISIHNSSFSVCLDPKKASNCDYTFVSHAHIDHIHKPNGKSKIIASRETTKLAKERGYDLGDTNEGAHGMDFFDSGHIFGSKAVLVKDSVFYTGDISVRNRGFLKGCRGVKCGTLIMETTYGKPRYVFPNTEQVIADANRFISRCFDSCRPVILTGYPLGKAQLISRLFDSWEPMFLHESVYKMNSAHIELGVKLKDHERFSDSESNEQTLKRSPWILIAPTSSRKSNSIELMRRKYGAAVAAFTGWAMDPSYAHLMNLDAAFPLSDHSDFIELVELAKYCDPSMIYTMHGFAGEFAAHLRSIGFEAEALSESKFQSKLTSYA
jgi:putative mRNA 3-end processing factor